MTNDFLPSRGRAGAVLFMSVVRKLTPQDFLNAQLKPARKLAAPVIQKLRTSHHKAAILVAEGRSNIEVAQLTGYTPQRISDMQVDPAFSELVIGYKKQILEGRVDEVRAMQDKLLDITELATDEIQRRLEDPGEMKKIPLAELRQVAQFGSDRTVAPPKAAPQNAPPAVSVTFKIGTRDLRPKDANPVEIEHDPQPVPERE